MTSPENDTSQQEEPGNQREFGWLTDEQRLRRAHAPLSSESGAWEFIVEPEDEWPRSIRLSPDYSAPSPLWPLSDETDAMVPEELLARLVQWQRDFDSNFHAQTGWKSEEAKYRWAGQAAELEADLRVALDGRAELTVDLWPL